jgi:hypothetical protein
MTINGSWRGSYSPLRIWCLLSHGIDWMQELFQFIAFCFLKQCVILPGKNLISCSIVYTILVVFYPLFFLVLKPNQIQLEEKQEQDGDHPLQLAPREIFNDEEEQLVNGFEQKLHVPKREEQPHPEPIDNKVWQRDIQWGRNTLQKLLTSLGLL